MAMTAWSAKVLRRAICLLGEGTNLRAPDQNHANRKPFSLQRGDQHGSDTLPVDGNLSVRELGSVKRCSDILNMDQFIVDRPLGRQPNRG